MKRIEIKTPQPPINVCFLTDPKKNPILKIYLEHGDCQFKFNRTKWYEINSSLSDDECDVKLVIGEHVIRLKMIG